MKKFVFAVAFIAVMALFPTGYAATIVNDVTKLDPIAVDSVVTPHSEVEVQALMRDHKGPISIGGGRYSMGGQIATENALFIDMRGMNKVVAFSKEKKEITVQAGMTWKEIQDYIDPYDLSLMIMQSYHNFSVGGSLSVNCHGRYVGAGPLIYSVKSIRIVLADGRLVDANPTDNADIFYGVIGGYGALGVITEATLYLADNVNVERQVQRMPVTAYKDYFFKNVRDHKDIIFHNGDIYAPAYDTVNVVNWVQTDKSVTVKDRMQPLLASYWKQQAVYFWMTELPFGQWLRQHVLDPWLYSGDAVVKRNYEASYDVQELEPSSRLTSTYVLEEYFVPVDRFDDFVPKMRQIFQAHKANIVNVSIRHAHKDPGSLMAWARGEVFAFVVYYKQGVDPDDRAEVGAWTRELIDAVLSVGGTYYLPYQPHATQAQFRQAYPNWQKFFALKKKLDPTDKFKNKLWDKYYHPDPAEQAVWDKKDTIPNYARSEDQTYLTLPEWYIVFSADEYACALKNGRPSQFPYFASIHQFWSIYDAVKAKTKAEYPYNFRYRLMINVIGTSYTAELFSKGVYENSIGRLTEWIAGDSAPAQNRKVEAFIQETAVDYASFLKQTPWYRYPFFTKWKQFLHVHDGPGTSFIRRWERRFAFTAEMLFKSVYGKVIGYATGSTYAPEDLHTYATAVKDEKLQILPITRYEAFTKDMPELVRQGVKFRDIAGNHRIMMTVVAPANWKAGPEAEEFYEWPILTNPGWKRIGLTVPVENLGAVIHDLDHQKIGIDHVFDY